MSYNGHPSRNYWNVTLWIGNDEGLYNLARECIRFTRNRRAAAERMLEALTTTPNTIPTTPDGSPYTVASIIHAMRGLWPARSATLNPQRRDTHDRSLCEPRDA